MSYRARQKIAAVAASVLILGVGIAAAEPADGRDGAYYGFC